MARRRISDEERALLDHAMRSVKPLRKTAAKAVAKPKAVQPAAKPPAAKPRATASKVTPPKAQPRNLRAIDRQTDQKLKRGKIIPDATLDLHGLSQSRAHARLVSFLNRASAEGSRTILVITGKGAPRADSSGDILQTGRGVLRDAVPRWLEEAPLRDLIWGIRTAGPRQGGEGAIYVLLKKQSLSRE